MGGERERMKNLNIGHNPLKKTMRNAPRTFYLLIIHCTANSEHVKLNVFEKDDFLPTSLLGLCLKRGEKVDHLLC